MAQNVLKEVLDSVNITITMVFTIGSVGPGTFIVALTLPGIL